MVDGNVSFENIPKMISNGAESLVLGTSGLFVKNQSLDESLYKLSNAIELGLLNRNEK